MSAAIQCVGFKQLERGSLLGFADLAMPSGMVLLGCTLHRSNGKTWCNPPARLQLDSERKPMLGDDGKLLYAPVVEFVDKPTRYRWSDEAVKAIDRYVNGKAPATMAGAMSGGSESRDGKSKEARSE